MDKDSILAAIFADDSFGILDVKPQSTTASIDQRLIDSFDEINQFIATNGHEPQASNDMLERRLYSRLQGIREDEQKIEALLSYDAHNILQNKVISINSLEDIFANDDLGILADNSANDIFNLQHVERYSERSKSENIQHRKKCKDFAKYEQLFTDCQADLKLNKREMLVFEESNLKVGTFFVLNGVLGYLAEKTAPVKRFGHRHDGRTYCIFENGTESRMQFLSLAARLYQARSNNNAFTISESQESALDKFNRGFGIVEDDDTKSGYIYVLKSLSTDPKIASIDKLYKIGYSTTPVEERIKNAVNEPTYLMAAVKVVAEYECYNLNPQKFEQLIHGFFAKACLNIDVFGVDNKRYLPREWFVVPLSIINEVIERVISGEIVGYIYDHDQEKLINKQNI